MGVDVGGVEGAGEMQCSGALLLLLSPNGVGDGERTREEARARQTDRQTETNTHIQTRTHDTTTHACVRARTHSKGSKTSISASW